MSANCRTPSHQSILCIFHFPPFLTKFILLAMCLVCLVSLPLLAMHIADLLFKTMKGDSSVTMSRSFFKKNSWIIILKCDKAIPAVHAALYSLSALDWTTGPVTCVPWSIIPIEILEQTHNLNKPTRALNCLNTKNSVRSINSHNMNTLQSALQQLDKEHP